ncbi:hypothetical protein K8Z49_16035 [Actinomadura madurae]|uniref:DAPG hydrolase PhiG domain-containing protein n=1 Tax=Actinomadura madurae TaxID=1993 RepID=A0A1I5KQT6_9ACTN|nr:hypothetical protein [Actinomadura madurae]SFO87243.1 hypothetical protein SAMN04489713_110100 [Actinomadura madurae]SPT49898.1 Uncharacterised protein [Actinomadura madurae]
MRYEPTPADRAPMPTGYAVEPRYLKYRETDEAKPYAEYFQISTRPVQEHVVHALVGGMAPQECGYGVDEVADRLARPGYEPLETGWTRLPGGVVMVAVHTPMPEVTAAMWDWWFGWHGRESARYKLWHPDAHQYCALAQDRSSDRSLTDRQRYIGNVAYVDEYIGGRLQPLAIRFLDPAAMGIAPASGTTHICARVSLSSHPIAIGWLVHQVRPTDDGAEMRSRFFLGDTALLNLPAHALPPGRTTRPLTSPIGRALSRTAIAKAGHRFIPGTIGADMVHHCAAEMNHLASFLPQLHQEFQDTP